MIRSLVIAACITGSVLTLSAQSNPMQEGPQAVNVVVRAESKGSPVPLQPSDIKAEFKGKPVQVTSVRPLGTGGATGANVEVALLIDDGLRGSFGTQLRDVEEFVQKTVSPKVAVGVGYMRNGGVYFPEGFSTEAEKAVQAIRLPMGMAGIDGSPYFCLQDLLKKWPVHRGVARVVLMISSGIDRYNGSTSPMNQNSPYVQSAMLDAQRAGVPVYSIYYGRRTFNSTVGSFSGQSYLSQLAEGTGGELYNGGSINPVSLSPYFTEFNTALRESYLVTFPTGVRRVERLKISSNAKGVKLHAQQAAGIAGAR